MQVGRFTAVILAIVLLCTWLPAQTQKQNFPDAPQPQQPLPPVPATESSSRDTTPPAPATQPTENNASATAASPAPTTPETDKPPVSAPQQVRNPETPDTERLYTLGVNVNFIEIPVTVKDDSGRMVAGLLPRDFSVYENGVRQKLSFFTSDPLAISAAVLIDVSMPATELRKVQAGLQALQGAFSPYDEVAVYTYGNSVIRESSFNAAGSRLGDALNRVAQDKHGTYSGVPVSGGPFGAGPTVNGHPMDPSVPQTPIVPRERHVLNDAVLEAALDLSKVQPGRRRIIMVIGEGREVGSEASYADVLKVLLTSKVSVYGIGIGTAGAPLVRKLEQINLPGTGNSNILPKYASATGGEVFSEITRQAIEQAYASVTVVARNQYTLGYYTQATLADNYRDIEVRVDRSGLRVTAKAGYYPLPPGRK
jgi:VWFA-related protein